MTVEKVDRDHRVDAAECGSNSVVGTDFTLSDGNYEHGFASRGLPPK